MFLLIEMFLIKKSLETSDYNPSIYGLKIFEKINFRGNPRKNKT